MLTKLTKRLFNGQYQYKLVLVCAGANWFRGGDWTGTLEHLKNVNLESGKTRNSIKTQEELDYAFKLQNCLKKCKDIHVRVETPWISIYSNNKSDIDSLIKIDKSKCKYVSVPPDKQLEQNVIILPKINFDFKVTLGKTETQHLAFLSWAHNSSKVKLTKSCEKELKRDRSWGGSYFYITGENNLLLAKMHLGGSINKIERIIKG